MVYLKFTNFYAFLIKIGFLITTIRFKEIPESLINIFPFGGTTRTYIGLIQKPIT